MTSPSPASAAASEGSSRPEPLGLIAGSRNLPLVIARQARLHGVPKIVAVAFENETSPELAPLVDAIEWVRVGQLSKLIKTFKKHGIQRCVMAGQIAPKNLFDLRPDLRALRALVKLKERNAHSLFTAVANELEADGVTLIEATPFLKPLMPDRGFHLGPKLTRHQEDDVAYGNRIAKEVSRLEIGQLVVVKNGTVLAVEGFEGTDPCLARGGQLAGPGGGAVAVKVAKENHDMRFDIPCIGLQTLQTCHRAGIAVLAIEARRTLILDLPEVETFTRESKIALVTTP